MSDRDCVLMVFSKAPDPGAVKTRLIPVLGEKKATELYKTLLNKTLQTCRHAGFAAIQLWCYPDTDHPYFSTCSRQFNAELREQRGSDLGERMWCALAESLKQYQHGIIIGCDCPDLSVRDLTTAIAKFKAGYDVVLGPSADGGYYLVGSNEADRNIFRDIPWGTASVLSLTRDRIRELELRCYLLPEHQDIDRPEDLGYGKWDMGNRK